jgi:rhodanese-related sulfurtransferase
MRTWLTTLVQAVALVATAFALGLGANQVRGDKNHLDLSRNYFPKIQVQATPESPSGPSKTTGKDAPPPPPKDHGLQTMDFDEAMDMFQDEGYELGMCIFVDARNEDLYAEGHIPGAYQLDHYRAEEYLLELLPIVMGADRVVLYCNGGNCEDSKFAANDLLEAGADYDTMYIYEGGWAEWVKNQGAVTTGDSP